MEVLASTWTRTRLQGSEFNQEEDVPAPPPLEEAARECCAAPAAHRNSPSITCNSPNGIHIFSLSKCEASGNLAAMSGITWSRLRLQAGQERGGAGG